LEGLTFSAIFYLFFAASGKPTKDLIHIFIFQKRGDIPAEGPKLLVGQSGSQYFEALTKTPGTNQVNYFSKFLQGIRIILLMGLDISLTKHIDPRHGTSSAASIAHGHYPSILGGFFRIYDVK
jgi:hypothetical protein